MIQCMVLLNSFANNVLTTLLLLVMIININAEYQGRIINSDSSFYTDEIYHELADEYENELSKPTLNPSIFGSRDEYESTDENIFETDQVNYDNEEGKPKEESYRDAIIRLQCDNPWFWNSFKCLWLDIRKRNYGERTKSNAITVAWMLGPPFCILLSMLCGSIVVACYLRSSLKAMQKKIEDLRNRYEPGKITLLDGQVKTYEPTLDEIEAFEDVISTLVSIV